MPKQTFRNLSKEKQELLLAAARDEFSRVPFAESSINKIIHRAGIPRGSFYMYFEDKEDLFRYIMGQYAVEMYDRFEELVRREQGDLLKTFSRIFDLILDYRDQMEQEQMMAIIRCNMGMEQHRLLQNMSCSGFLGRILPLIDRTKLQLYSEDDLPHMLDILLHVIGPMLFLATVCGEPDRARRDYQVQLDILARGLGRPQERDTLRKGD